MAKSVEINYTRVAEKELSKLEKTTAKRIVEKIFDNASQGDILVRAKPLTGQFAGAYRYRVGEYRVVFVFNEKGDIIVLTVVSIKHRKDIYR